ncbi:MAG TPA: FAD-binding oxidoreductase [Candidatus Acidoferrales bacterium]|jgi:glycolate oxidase FAD binding subunit|nr:FAD-binding oxidoreductase [Candidatus Acidoferrales bacterium]
MNSVANLPNRLEKLVGSDRVRASESALREFAISGRAPMAVLKPRSAEEVAEIVSFAAAEKLAVVPCGSCSKLELGMPPQRYDLAMDMTDLRQIEHYDPGDLTLSVDAGLPLNELAKALAAKNQFLPLAVPCGETSTVGGAIASGIDSTLRQQYGTPRDSLIGAEFVDGTGKQCKSGGRVVKNVTGYDLHKLLIGSLGTLAVITRLNFRTFPLPDLQGAHLAGFPTLEAALNFHASLLKSGLPLSNTELFDSDFSALLAGFLNKEGASVPESLANHGWQVFASFEGSAPVMERIHRELRERSVQAQAVRSETLSTRSCQQVSEALREAFQWLRRAAPSVALLRIVLPQFAPGDATELLHVAHQSPLRSAFVLHACNVAYLALLADSEDVSTNAVLEHGVAELFSRVEAKKGSTTVLHAPVWLKDRINVWGARRADFPMMQRVKQAFDPHHIFAPGRFVGGI